MTTPASFNVNHIQFQRDRWQLLSQEEKSAHWLTLLGAAAVSALSYKSAEKATKALHNDANFQLVKTQDIVSSIWPLAKIKDLDFTQDNPDAGIFPPLLVWSNRLQAVFLGIRGTARVAQVWSGVDIADVVRSPFSERYHAGFYARAFQYSGLIEQLARRYRVIVCGHSLGGALGTLATYLALETEPDLSLSANVWERDSTRGLSVVTFGSPPSLVVKDAETTAAIQSEWIGNFHHIIDPHDPIPFLLSHEPTWATKFLSEAAKATRTEYMNLRGTCWPLMKWISRGATFAQYGSLYILDSDGETIGCVQVTHPSQIPNNSPEIYRASRYHTMSHYSLAICRANRQFPVYATGPLQLQSMTAGAFSDHCLSLPESLRECTGMIHENMVSITIAVRSRLVPFLVDSVTVTHEGDELAVDKVDFEVKPDNHDEILMTIRHEIEAGQSLRRTLEFINSLRKEIRIYDSFGRVTSLPIREMRSTSLEQSSLPGTFDSPRMAMIIAFADQITKVHALKVNQEQLGYSDSQSYRRAGILTEKAELIAELIDCVVSTACPELLVKGLQHAWEVSNELWPSTASSSARENTTPLTAPLLSLSRSKLSAWPPNLHLSDCPDQLKKVISGVLNVLSEEGIKYVDSLTTPEHEGEELQDRQLGNLIPRIPSFEKTLKGFGLTFYDRPSDPHKRISHAIQQADEVLSVIRFCHVVILTQLDNRPREKFSGLQVAMARNSLPYADALPIDLTLHNLFGGSELVTSSTLTSSSVITVDILGKQTNSLGRKMNRAESLFALESFQGRLNLSRQILRLPQASLALGSQGVIEGQIEERLREDIPKADSLRTLEKWRTKLREGLTAYPGMKSYFAIKPTLYWPQWLFHVARVGQLRNLMASEVRIGVEGPTEAGKSELLTTLTGAEPRIFGAGSSSIHRTMEIQSYRPPGNNAVFVDSPGADDRDYRIRQMARMFREMFGILIFVIPCDRRRSQGTEKALREIANYLRDRKSDLRPVRILLSKADQLEYHRKRPDVFHNAISECKKTAIHDLRSLGNLEIDFVIHSRKVCDGMSLLVSETLEEIVHPYSTYAQMSLDNKKALSDCPPGEERKIEGLKQFQALYRMAEEGKLWDVESLRQWLRELSPKSVKESSTRVFQNNS
ncbi:hypothetical protein QBC35DRAFT_436549 [Podospora australis]|uniref:Fungal lipase-like domain-containing protein n=1 Tax=Podospora australis TaxID=1536484 RepID=A0AAN6WSS7_9PEZI|nr:hypothetical protein QBC35DRAFT_436549 [Podospora australis]